MAITFTERVATLVNNPLSTSMVSGSFTAGNGARVIIVMAWDVFSGARGTVNTLTGSSISGAALITNGAINDTAGTGRIEAWLATGTGSAGAITGALTGAGSNIDKAYIYAVELAGDASSGTIVQAVAVAGRLAIDWAAMPLTLAALADSSNNAVFTFAACAVTGTAWTGPSTYTNLSSSDTTYAYTADYKVPGTTTPTVDKADFNYLRGVALEISADVPPPVTTGRGLLLGVG